MSPCDLAARLPPKIVIPVHVYTSQVQWREANIMVWINTLMHVCKEFMIVFPSPYSRHLCAAI
jgi:hypothetical protein